MAVEFFISPIVTVDGWRWAKYQNDPQVERSGMIRFSRQEEAILMLDAPQSFLDTVAADPDVLRICTKAELDDVLTAGQRTAVRNQLEQRNIPAQWVNAGDTWRNVIRGTVGVFLFSQRVEGRTGNGITFHFQQGNVALDDTWADLPQAGKDIILETAASFGWENPGFTGTSTLREILWFMSQQFESTEIFIGGEAV